MEAPGSRKRKHEPGGDAKATTKKKKKTTTTSQQPQREAGASHRAGVAASPGAETKAQGSIDDIFASIPRPAPSTGSPARQHWIETKEKE